VNITLDANPSANPGCLKIVADDGRDLLAQTDWEWPAIATTFGWSVSSVEHNGQECTHDGTDGTIQCQECGCQPGDFIKAARQWLDDNDGATAEDPGYFDI
jgi:hypothetical protein